MNKELINRYCQKYPDYNEYEWFENINGTLSCLKGIDALTELVPQYERALHTLEDIVSIINDIETEDHLINDYLQIGEALSQIQIILELYNAN